MARDPKRIKKILKKIERLWEKNPDWRLGQLVINVISTENVSGLLLRPTREEIFNFEDDKFEELIKEML